MGLHVVAEGSDARVAFPVRQQVAGPFAVGDLLGELPALLDPLLAAAVHHAQVLHAVQGQHPEREGCPPVVLVAIEDNLRVLFHTQFLEQAFEVAARDVVPLQFVIQILHPVQIHGTGDMADFIKQRILIAFH